MGGLGGGGKFSGRRSRRWTDYRRIRARGFEGERIRLSGEG